MPSSVSGWTLLWRALRRRCPRCGRGRIFSTHFRMNRDCPSCHAVFWKDPGESLGAMYVDYVLAFSLFFVSWGLLYLFTNLSELTQIALLSLITVGGLLIFYPLSRSIWTLLIYVSGGIDRPPIKVISGGKKTV